MRPSNKPFCRNEKIDFIIQDSTLMKKFWGSTAMIIATILWGFAFSAQSSGVAIVEPILFTALRSIVGVLALIIVIAFFDLFREKRVTLWGKAETKEAKRELLVGGWWCGFAISVACICQQYGLKYISAGKTGFLTALYIVIVPLLGIFFKRKTSYTLWIAVALALSGSYLLCGGIDNIGIGEWFVIACAVLYSGHIMVIDKYAAKCDCVRLSCIQFIIATILSAIASWLAGDPWIMDKIIASMPFWIFCGVGSSAIAFTLQMVSQKYLHPVTATLLMSLESVFGVLGGWLFLNEILTTRELLGCAVIFAGIILSQLPAEWFRKKLKTETYQEQ